MFLQSAVSTYVMDKLVKDPDTVLDSTKVKAVAVELVKKWKPRKVYTADIAGDGSTYRYSCASYLSNWVDSKSQIVKVNYPVGYQGENLLPLDYLRIQKNSSGLDELLFIDSAFSSGYTGRVHYTGLHVLHATVAASTTLQEDDFMQLCWRVAEEYCNLLASHYANKSSTALGADAVDYRSRSREYQALAKKYVDKAKVEAKQEDKSGVFGDWDRKDEISGHGFFFHGRHTR